MLRIITANLNGIRSAYNKGFGRWLARQRADVVCLQELKAHKSDLTPAMSDPKGLHAYFCCALRKGYSGVGLYARTRPDNVTYGFANSEFDDEGRYVQADFGLLSVVSLYLPSGSSSEERQHAKFRCMAHFLLHLLQRKARKRAGKSGLDQRFTKAQPGFSMRPLRRRSSHQASTGNMARPPGSATTAI